MNDRTTDAHSAAIRVRDLARHFGDVRAVDGVSFEVSRGSLFGFLGPNGSGKTTTIRMLLGILPPTAGSAHVLGRDVATNGAEIREHSGALFAETGLYERLTAEDNLEFYGRVWNLTRAARRERIRDALERAGLWDRRRDRVGSWSRGMKQRLALARVFLHGPELVFLDEPTQGLDPRVAAEMRSEIRGRVSRRGCTVFLTTHNLAEAEGLCDRVAVIHHGRIQAVGTPAELRRTARAGEGDQRLALRVRTGSVPSEALAMLRTAPGVQSVDTEPDGLEIGIESEETVPTALRILIQAGAEVREARTRVRSLEEVYLALTAEGEA